MARIRSVKPDFFTDADLCELSPLHRLLFQALWCQADRDGRLEDKPRELKVKCLPYDACDVDALLVDLDQAEFIVRYEVDGQRYIAIPKFAEHQKFHRDEKPLGLPGIPENHQRVAALCVTPEPESVTAEPARVREKPRLTQRKAAPDVGRLTSVNGHRTSDIGLIAGELPPAGWRELAEGLFKIFEKLRGSKPAPRGRDWKALRELRTRVRGSDAEILLRWERGLRAEFKARCDTFADLSERWDALAVDPARGKSSGEPAPGTFATGMAHVPLDENGDFDLQALVEQGAS